MQIHHNMKGKVSSIRHFMLEDGPGIRTVVFFSGCPLRCMWCSSPRTWTADPAVLFNKHKCIGCGTCFSVCDSNAVSLDGDYKILHKNCIACGNCVEFCPSKALSMSGTEVDVDYVMSEIEKDIDYYTISGGGVTISGGEVLNQAKFALEILERCRLRNIHTAVESCGFAPWETFCRILESIDVLKIDIKCMDEADHIKWTGQSNQIILHNIEMAAKEGLCDIIISLPLVPGYNDSLSNLEKTAQFMNENGLKRVHILPFHKLGLHEYEELDLNYPAADIPVPGSEEIKRAQQVFSDHGIEFIK